MRWKVRVNLYGLQKDFGVAGEKDKAYRDKKSAEKRARKIERKYSKYPTAKVRVIRSS